MVWADIFALVAFFGQKT